VYIQGGFVVDLCPPKRILDSYRLALRTKSILEAEMKRLFPGLGALVLVAFVSLALPSHAQTDAAKTQPFVSLKYDISQEVKLSGTITDVVTQPSESMLSGSHLILQTASGSIDAQLGGLRLAGRDAISVAPGEQVQVTGVIKTIHNQAVLLTRLIEVNGRVYELRNEHGIYRGHPERTPVSAAAATPGSKGGTR
jgi:hypothetical protein